MLRQIKVRYDALEDRLLLSLQVDEQTHHLLLTRRVWTNARSRCSACRTFGRAAGEPAAQRA